MSDKSKAIFRVTGIAAVDHGSDTLRIRSADGGKIAVVVQSDRSQELYLYEPLTGWRVGLSVETGSNAADKADLM